MGKLSGAMGTFAHQGPEVEAYVCAKLGLTPDPVSNQIVQRDRHAAYASALALLAANFFVPFGLFSTTAPDLRSARYLFFLMTISSSCGIRCFCAKP